MTNTLKVEKATINGQQAASMVAVHRDYEKSLNRPIQRPESHDRIAQYAAILKRGQWLPCVANVTVDVNGRIINGYTTLNSIIISNVPADLLLVTGVPAELSDAYFMQYDNHRRRSGADLIHAVVARKRTGKPSTLSLPS